MLKNYFTIAWRNLFKNKSFAFINIAGLGISIAACILTGFFVYNEISFDSQVADKDNIYRLNEYVHYDGTAPQVSAATGPPIASFLSASHKEIKNYTRVFPATPHIYTSVTLEYQGKKFTTGKLVCTDTSFADIFAVTIIEGGRHDFIKTQNSIVLTQSLSEKFFGKAAAVNKMLALHTTANNRDTVIYVAVSNVIANLPETSHMQVEGLLPIPHDFEMGTNYGVLLGPTYLQLQPGIKISTFQQSLTNTIHVKNKFIDMQLQPLTQVHGQSISINYDFFNYNKIDGRYIRIFIMIALAIFVIACINFINLTIAIAGYRIKETAIKKIMGASPGQIILQLLTETFLSVFLALLLAILLAAFFLPFLNTVLQRKLDVNVLYRPAMMGMYAIVLVVTTFLAGLYPAWLISSPAISHALKNKMAAGKSRNILRNVLVTGQFAIAVIFIVSTIIFLKQLNFLQKKDIGYSYSQVIKFPLDMQTAGKLPVLHSELLKIKGVTDITHGYMEMGGSGSLFGINYIAPGGENKQVSVNMEDAAANYIHFFGMKIIKGRDFSGEKASNEYLVNETLARQIGYSNPVGKQINIAGGYPPGIIIGVVKDFNYRSLHTPIEPLLISAIDYIPYWKTQLYIKVSTADLPQTIKQVEALLTSVSGNAAIGFQFLDDHFKEVYNVERQAGTMVGIIGGLAIIIACFGLLGLTTFIIMRRTKEIGIRKIVGASVQNIALMLSGEFLQLICIAVLIAFPIAWLVMNQWLRGFAYRVNIGAEVFLMATAIILFITVLTISFQAIKAALANPVKSLRTE